MYKRLLQGFVIGLCLAVANFAWELWRVWNLGADSREWAIYNALLLGFLLMAVSVLMAFGYWRTELHAAYTKKTGRYWGRRMEPEEKLGVAVVFAMIVVIGVIMAVYF